MKMIRKILCHFGYHKYCDWKYLTHNYGTQTVLEGYRFCKYCNKLDTKIVDVINKYINC